MPPANRMLAAAVAGALLVAAVAGCRESSRTPAPTSPAASADATSSTAAAGDRAKSAPASPGRSPTAVPRFDHIVVAMEENHSFDEVLDSGRAPYLQRLAAKGAVLTQSYAVAHPSQPNYLALFSGSTQGVVDDSCPHNLSGANLATALTGAGDSFVGYSESMPAPGYAGCRAGAYARKHNPWVNFPAVPESDNQPMSAFPADLAALPTVAFVIPDLDHDMHDGTVAAADSWLQAHLGAYAAWAATHNSLLVVTADEDDSSHENRIPTVLVGAHVEAGMSGQRIDHYGLLRTMLDSLGIAPIGRSASSTPLTGIWLS